MLEKIKIIFALIFHPRQLRILLSLKHKGFLIETGWFHSALKKTSINKFGYPIPWYTYSSIKFLENRLSNKLDVFEYGSGNSTLWYSKKVKSITALEHNEEWFNRIRPLLPQNATIIFREFDNSESYARQILIDNLIYHIVIVDAIDRITCTKYAVQKLRDDGVIIFDNTDRVEYQVAYKFLENQGFKKLDFWGLGPIVTTNSCTTIFYRSGNCLGI